MAGVQAWQEGLQAWGRLARPTKRGTDPLAALGDVRVVRGLLLEKEREIVAIARPEHSWSQIGGALGVTRQAAWDRWHHLDTAEEA